MAGRIVDIADWREISATGQSGAFMVRLPWTGSGSGVVELPIFRNAAAAGPRVLVAGGTHGDEFEGQMAASHLISQLPQLSLNGSITVLPRHNQPACAAGTRCSPLDGADLNRLYTGEQSAGASGAIAAFVTQHLLPEIDWLIDLHSGGATHEFVLSSNLQATVGSAEDHALRPALQAFGAPFAIIFDDIGSNTMPHRGTLEGAARAMGVKCISSELGGGGRLTPASTELAVRGLLDLLVHIGVLDARHRSNGRHSTRFLRLDHADHYCRAPADGMVVPLVSLGEAVEAGAAVAEIICGDAFGGVAQQVLAARSGIVAAVPTTALFRRGDMVVAIAEEA
jgi:predicted deacylase